MTIIDAHLHLFPTDDPKAEALTRRAGHHNNLDHLRQAFGQLNIVHAVVMGNRSLEVGYHQYPADLFHYCVGLDNSLIKGGHLPPSLAERVEEHLRRDLCCGVKLYPGYQRIWLTDPVYEPIYRLAAQYGKPVAIHMGLTAGPRAYLKYCHPLVLDEAAADHPDTQFVMCHFGNPFLEAAAAVVEKNPNVAADLSGFLEGRVDLERYRREQEGYLSLLKTWLRAIDRWDDLLYGSDWPLVNLADNLAFVRELVPEAHWEQVFFANANRLYNLGL